MILGLAAVAVAVHHLPPAGTRLAHNAQLQPAARVLYHYR